MSEDFSSSGQQSNITTISPFAEQIAKIEAELKTNQDLLNDPELGQLASKEIEDLQAQLEALQEAEIAMNTDYSGSGSQNNSPTDINKANCIIEIRGGAGGDEAKIWAGDLFRMYSRFCDKLGLKIEYLDDMVIKIRGKVARNILDPEARTASVQSLAAYALFRYESGVHRVQRVPETEAQGRIHTSTASVAVLPEVNATDVEIKSEDLDWQFIRASGAGGQNVNKVNSAVRLTHVPTGIVVTARQERKQAQNREIALALLRSRLWEIQEEERQKQLGDARSAIGRAQRAEKIRTYNYPQSRVTDHRLNQSWHNLPVIMDGYLEEIWLACELFFSQENKTDVATNTENIA